MCVLSGAGGSVAAARASGSTARSRSSIVWRNWRSGLASAGRVARPGGAARWISSLALAHGAAADDRGVAERLERGRGRLGERPQAGEEGVEARPTRRRRSRSTGCWACASSPSRPMYGLELAEEGRQLAEVGGQLVAPRGGDLGGAGRPRARSGVTSRLRASSAPTTRSASARSATRSSRVWRPRTRSVSLVSRRPGCGAPEHLVEVLRAPGQPRAQLADDQAQPVAVRAAQDVVDQVEPGSSSWSGSTGTRPPSGSRLGEVPGWQSTKYSPMNDCGRTSQRASSRRSAKPGSVTSASTTRQRPRLALEIARSPVVAGAHAGDLEVAALGQAEGVVEHDLVGLALGVVVARRRPSASARRDARGQRRATMRRRASRAHRPLARVAVERGRLGGGEHVACRRRAGSSFAPGQRRNWPIFGPGP